MGQVNLAPELLVIEDDAVFGHVLAQALTRRGYAVRHARNASDALGEAQSQRPKYVILDLNLGGSSGLALIKPLLALAPECRIVVLTGYASIATAVDAIKLGATHYLAKPADISAIIRALGCENPEPEGEAPSEPLSVSRLEWEHIQRVLAEHQGNISATARALKMHRRTLQRKLGKRPVQE